MRCLPRQVDGADRAGHMLYLALRGMGTRNYLLISTVVEHCEVDMVVVKAKFPAIVARLAKDGAPRELKDMIHADTSGSFRGLLLALIGEPLP